MEHRLGRLRTRPGRVFIVKCVLDSVREKVPVNTLGALQRVVSIALIRLF